VVKFFVDNGHKWYYSYIRMKKEEKWSTQLGESKEWSITRMR